MKMPSEKEITETLQRVMPDITSAEIQDLKAIRTARERLKAEQGSLFNAIAGLLYRHDPEGVVFDEREHEYEGEVGTIIPRLPDCKSAEDVRHVVHEEFSKWFAGHIKPAEHYKKIAAEIWELWQRHNAAKRD